MMPGGFFVTPAAPLVGGTKYIDDMREISRLVRERRGTLFLLVLFWLAAFCTGATLYVPGMWPWAIPAVLSAVGVAFPLVARLVGMATEED